MFCGRAFQSLPPGLVGVEVEADVGEEGRVELRRLRVRIMFGLVFIDVPGATPKKPASGLMAYSRPSGPTLIQAMSSPRV